MNRVDFGVQQPRVVPFVLEFSGYAYDEPTERWVDDVHAVPVHVSVTGQSLGPVAVPEVTVWLHSNPGSAFPEGGSRRFVVRRAGSIAPPEEAASMRLAGVFTLWDRTYCVWELCIPDDTEGPAS